MRTDEVGRLGHKRGLGVCGSSPEPKKTAAAMAARRRRFADSLGALGLGFFGEKVAEALGVL